MTKAVTAALLVLTLLLAQQQAVWGWGRDGHMYVNQVAAEKLPQDVPAFMRNDIAELAYLGPEADRWQDDSDPAAEKRTGARSLH